MQSRYYDFNICKFINADDPSILLADPFNVQCVHIYDYCENDPVNSTDKTGKARYRINSKHKYNRSNVVKYIKKWVTKRNPAYDNFKNRDCTNFVSQCLHVGGFPMNFDWRCVINSKLNKVIRKKKFYTTAEWCNAEALCGYVYTRMLRYNAYTIKNTSQLDRVKKYLMAGDLIFFRTESSKSTFNHAAIIYQIKNGKIKYAQHSGDSASEELYTRLKYCTRKKCPKNEKWKKLGYTYLSYWRLCRLEELKWQKRLDEQL